MGKKKRGRKKKKKEVEEELEKYMARALMRGAAEGLSDFNLFMFNYISSFGGDFFGHWAWCFRMLDMPKELLDEMCDRLGVKPFNRAIGDWIMLNIEPDRYTEKVKEIFKKHEHNDGLDSDSVAKDLASLAKKKYPEYF